jgi:N utilization substance protein B
LREDWHLTGRDTLTDLPEFNPDDYEIEIVEHPEAATERSIARRFALQVLYEIDSVLHPIGDVITHRLANNDTISRKTERYVRVLVLGVHEHRDLLDSTLQGYASEFPLDQVAIIDRNILRMAVYEMVSQDNLPISVAISEAMELANLFGAEGTPRFINGVLGAIATSGLETLRPQFRSGTEDA